MAGAGTSAEPEASSNHKTPKETDVPSSLVANPEGVPVIVSTLSDRETMNMPDAIFLGMAQAARSAREWVEVPGGTYSGSRSSSESMTMQADGETDFDHPRA